MDSSRNIIIIGVVLVASFVCLAEGISVDKDLSLTLSQKNTLDKVIYWH